MAVSECPVSLGIKILLSAEAHWSSHFAVFVEAHVVPDVTGPKHTPSGRPTKPEDLRHIAEDLVYQCSYSPSLRPIFNPTLLPLINPSSPPLTLRGGREGLLSWCAQTIC